MTTATTTTNQTLYPTKVKCAQCGGPVYAQNQLELRLIRAYPKDGHWLCPDCRPKWGKEWGRR